MKIEKLRAPSPLEGEHLVADGCSMNTHILQQRPDGTFLYITGPDALASRNLVIMGVGIHFHTETKIPYIVAANCSHRLGLKITKYRYKNRYQK